MIPDRETVEDRALSQEAVAALGFGGTIVMMAIAGFVLMQSGASLTSGGPITSIEADPIAPDGAQWLRVQHTSGENVNVSTVTVVVEIPTHDKKARLRDVPTKILDQGDYTGHHVFVLGNDGFGGELDADAGNSDGTFGASDTLEFRLSQRRVDLTKDDYVIVTLVDEHSGSEIASTNVTVAS